MQKHQNVIKEVTLFLIITILPVFAKNGFGAKLSAILSVLRILVFNM